MLTLEIPEKEYYDERKCEFVNVPGFTLELEHSLISISEWESKWKKSFLSSDDKTDEQVLDYVKCMILNDVNPNYINYLSINELKQIYEYMGDSQTATVIKRRSSANGHSRDIITSELVYYWMIALNIPMECQTWNINRLLTLIDVVSLKQQPPKKMSKKDAMAQQQSLNAQRRANSKSKG